MKKLALLALLACGFGPEEKGRFVAHEWGTFTTVSGADGALLDWRPLLGPDDLPKFVYRMGESLSKAPSLGKRELTARVRMETPVIYFYSEVDVDVSAKVGFPQGKVTEWYPQATNVSGGLEWANVRLRPGSTAAFPREPGESHYYPARETDATPLSVAVGGKTQHEKLLFYRGLGWFEPPLKATLQGRQVVVGGNATPQPAEAFLFERRGGAVGWRRAALESGEARIARPELTGSVESLERALEEALTASGLYPKESAAMVKTWRDTWFEDGVRVLYLLPRAWTDKILPLTLSPRPSELVRTMVCRAEIITPEREQEAMQLLMRNDAAANEALRKQGRFLEPTLRRLQRSVDDPELRKRIAGLLPKGS